MERQSLLLDESALVIKQLLSSAYQILSESIIPGVTLSAEELFSGQDSERGDLMTV